MDYQLAAIGELLIDFVQDRQEPGCLPRYIANPGGAPGNVCTMFSKLGGRASFIGKVGKDAFGYQLQNTLIGCGIETDGLIIDASVNTSLAFVSLDENSERSFSFYRKQNADTQLKPEEIPCESWNKAKILHFGSVSLSEEPSRCATLTTVQKAREKGLLISYDPNYRPLLWSDPEEAREILWQGTQWADILKISEEEMLFMIGETDPQKGVKAFRKTGASVILITLGRNGAYYCVGPYEGLIEGFRVNSVDTTGAGDAFVGAFLYCVMDMSRDELTGMEEAQIRKIVRFSNAAAALATTKYGAIPAMPSFDEVEKVLKSYIAI